MSTLMEGSLNSPKLEASPPNKEKKISIDTSKTICTLYLFLAQFGLVNLINTYLRLKNLSLICICVSEIFKTCFLVQNNSSNLCVCMVNSQRLFWYLKLSITPRTNHMIKEYHLIIISIKI
jgi:hypothetical protein